MPATTRKRGSRVKWLVLAVVVVVIIVIVIVVAATVTKQRKRDKSTDVAVTTERINTSTKPAYSTQEAVATATPTPTQRLGYVNHTEVVTLVPVFTSDRLEVILNFTFQYSVRPEDLAAVIDTFGPSYTETVRLIAIDGVKTVATDFSVLQFVNNPAGAGRVMYEDLRRKLWGSCCRPWCQSLQRGCESGCLEDAQCLPMHRTFYADLLALRLDAVDVPDIILDRLRTPQPPP